MAKSKSKKMIEKQIREGKRDPRNSRGGQFIKIKTTTTRTKTKREELLQIETKHKKRFRDYQSDNNETFFIFV